MEIAPLIIFSVIITLYSVRVTWKLVDTQQEIGKLLITQAVIQDANRDKDMLIHNLTVSNSAFRDTGEKFRVANGIAEAEIVRLKELLDYSQETVKLLERSPKRVTSRNTPDEFAEMAENRYPQILKERASGKET